MEGGDSCHLSELDLECLCSPREELVGAWGPSWLSPPTLELAALSFNPSHSFRLPSSHTAQSMHRCTPKTCSQRSLSCGLEVRRKLCAEGDVQP